MCPDLTVSTVNMIFGGGMVFGGYFGALGMWLVMIWKRQRERVAKCDAALRSPEYQAYAAAEQEFSVCSLDHFETYEKPNHPGIKFIRRVGDV